MANTFKVKTNGAMPASAGTPLTLYTVPSSTTCVVIGLVLNNIHTTGVTASVQLVSDTSDTETNETVFLAKDISVPVGSPLELTKAIVKPETVLELIVNTSPVAMF